LFVVMTRIALGSDKDVMPWRPLGRPSEYYVTTADVDMAASTSRRSIDQYARTGGEAPARISRSLSQTARYAVFDGCRVVRVRVRGRAGERGVVGVVVVDR